MAFQSTGAAFSATTENTGNAFVAGTVTDNDNDAGSAMFNVSAMAGGDSAVGCIEVAYSGSLNPEVRLYGASTAGGGPDDTFPYRFTITLQDTSAAQGGTATVDFTWEAQDL